MGNTRFSSTASQAKTFRDQASSRLPSAGNVSVAEKMLNMTRQEPDTFQINDHKNDIRKQLLDEAFSKRFALQTKLVKIEKKRIKSVSDTLLTNELQLKIEKADVLIKKLKFELPSDYQAMQQQEKIDYYDFVQVIGGEVNPH